MSTHTEPGADVPYVVDGHVGMVWHRVEGEPGMWATTAPNGRTFVESWEDLCSPRKWGGPPRHLVYQDVKCDATTAVNSLIGNRIFVYVCERQPGHAGFHEGPSLYDGGGILQWPVDRSRWTSW